MYIGTKSEFCDATALSTGGTGLALIGNVIDTSVARDLGQVDKLYLVIGVTTPVGFGAAGTVSFILASDAQAAIATDGSASEHITSPTFSGADLQTAGDLVIEQQLPFDGFEEFLGILQDVGTNALTAGAVNAYLTDEVRRWKATPANTGY